MTSADNPAIVLDTSAVMAILLDEPAGDALIEMLDGATLCLMSTATRLELGIVAEARLGPPGRDAVARFLREAEVELVPVDSDAAEGALRAWRRFGRGRHQAGLNYGDCFVYALADATGSPVLCTGDDFPATDITAVPRLRSR